MLKIISLITVSLLAASAHADSFSALCLSQGTSVGGNDMGAFTSDSRLNIMVTSSKDGLLKLRAEGIVLVANSIFEVGAPSLLNGDNAYMAMFDYNASENPDYRPVVYEGYAQFKDFDAVYTVGMESGMWGYLVIEKASVEKDQFQAAYVFQAGDHMGGTLYFSCKK